MAGGGVRPRKRRRPRVGASRGACCLLVMGRSGVPGLEGLELLLCGGAIVSLSGSGVRDRASTDGNGTSSGNESISLASTSELNVAGTISSARPALGDGILWLDRGT